MDTPEIALEIVNLIGKASKRPNELGRFITDFTNATFRWIRPLFLIDEKEDADLSAYKADPENPATIDSKDIILAKIKKALNENSEMKKEFNELIELMKEDGILSKFINNVFGDKNTFIQGGSGNKITIKNDSI